MAFLWVIEMSKHTPGPWFHHGSSGSEHTAGGFIKSSAERNSGPLICSIYGTDGQPYKANAQLISAAPDLLAAAERVLAKLDHPTLGVTIYDADALRQAIAKARGEA